MINLEDLEVLKGKTIYNTNNDTYVLYEKNEKSITAVDFKLLGVLNEYSYAYADHYLVKSTLDQTEIARILLDVDTGVFVEKFSYAYFYKDNKVYQVTENLIINWSLSFDDNIRQIYMDNYGDIYVLFMNSRIIRKYSKDGEYIFYLNESDDPSKYSRLYAMNISEGGGHLYVIGSDFWDNKVVSFVDHYNLRKCKLIDRQILCEYNNVAVDNDYFTYKDIFIDGDYMYIYANNYIQKVNIKLREIWKYNFGYNYLTNTTDCLTKVVFDDEKFKNRIFFCENFHSSGGYSFGKLSTNGNLLWKVIYPENMEKTEFNICVYKSDIYMTSKRDITAKANYVLSIDNNKVLFETRDGELIRIVENNYDMIYDPANYTGEYLIGNSIKEGINKVIDYIFAHDLGEVVTENGDYILFTNKNNDYNNPDNYDHFRLVGTEVTDTPVDYTCIRTDDNKMIMTKNQSYIQTLFHYNSKEGYQYMTTVEGDLLGVDDDKNIIRSKAIFVNEFYLLADFHRFLQGIVTKKNDFELITKKKGHVIVRKAKYVYKYIVKRLIDIDIIVQHLEENGILETLIPHYVDKLRHNTTHMIEDMQKALSPTYFNLGSFKRYSYRYDGYDYPLRISNTQMFLCKNLPYVKKRYKNSIYIESLSTLIDNSEMTPFMLFLNGKAIKWSDIIVVRDWVYSYLIINNNADESENLEAIMFPCTIRYGEDNAILPDNKCSMYFDNEGKLTSNIDDISFRIEVIDKDVIGMDHIINTETPYLDFSNIESKNVTENNNIFAFEDGYFFGDSRFYLDNKGKNIYTYARDTANLLFKTFYFDKANESKNMIFELPNQEEAHDNIIDKIESTDLSPTDNFLVPFDFKLSIDKTYLKNISEATKYILTYKMQLLIDYYRDQSNIKSYTYNGDHVLTLASRSSGYLTMPRQKNNGLHDYIMVFKNDHLYEYYQEIIYENRVFKIPIFHHVETHDKIEILHFKNVDNNYSSLTVNDEDDYISEDLRYDNFILFGNSYSGKSVYDNFDIEKNYQYSIDFDYMNHFNDYGKYKNTSIQLLDSYYRDKKINICSKRQFHYMGNKIYTNGTDEIKLTPEFRFCHNINQYIIFVNTKKLNADEWIVNLPSETNFNISIKLDNALNKDDRVHIFYIPEPYEEIILENHTNSVGDIIMDVSELDYPFDSELFMIFADGNKIIADDIQNISSNRIRIKTNIPLQSNICVCKYLNPDKLLQKVFSYGDIWTKSTESITADEYEKLFVKAKK